MRENEAAAHALVAQLGAAGVVARVSGAGVHWQVDAGPVAARTLRVHCFWYERAVTGLLLAMNPANARSRLRGAPPPPYEGPEYLVVLHDGDARIADGRARDGADVVACTRAWLAGVELAELVREVPFVDARGRSTRALAERLDPRLRREIGGDPSYELWVYGEDRSCKVITRGDAVACSFLLGQAQVAHGAAVGDLPAAVDAWLTARVPVRALVERAPGVALERHAEVLEADPARWHWLHVRDRIADPHDVLAPLGSLIQALAASPVATAFYSYSSLYRLCFSASSHYPWVNDGLPVVAPAGDASYQVDDARCDLDGAVRLIEAKLSAYPIRPFFGSAPHHELPPLAESLARQGSVLRPELVQRGGWYDLVVADAAATRRCTVSGRFVAFGGATGQLDATWPTLDDAADAIRSYCERGSTLDEIAADPRAQDASRRGPPS